MQVLRVLSPAGQRSCVEVEGHRLRIQNLDVPLSKSLSFDFPEIIDDSLESEPALCSKHHSWVDSAIAGNPSTIITYGQTHRGKSASLSRMLDVTLQTLFEALETHPDLEVSVSLSQVYQDQLYCLFRITRDAFGPDRTKIWARSSTRSFAEDWRVHSLSELTFCDVADLEDFRSLIRTRAKLSQIFHDGEAPSLPFCFR